MSIETGSTKYDLKRSFKYSHNGNSDNEATWLQLNEPGFDHVNHALKMEQMVQKALMELVQGQAKQREMTLEDMAGGHVKPLHEDTEAIEESAETNVEVIKLAIMQSNHVELSAFIEVFKKIVTMNLSSDRSACLVNGLEPMTNILWQRMNIKDMKAAAFRYAAFFAMPSDEDE